MTSSSPAPSDRVAALLAAFAQQEHEDEFRALLLQHNAQLELPSLAAALTCLFMLRSGVARTAVIVAARHLFPLTPEQMAGAHVVVMDGTHLFCPTANAEGQIYRIPSMEPVDPSKVTEPLVATVFDVGRIMRTCQEVVGP